MNFEKLNKLTFTTVNPDNNYVCWDSEHSLTAPRLTYENISEKEIAISESDLDRVVYQSVLEYLNEEELCNNDSNMFPRTECLTGNYYIAEIYYEKDTSGLHGYVLTHFTELFTGGVVTTPVEQDYLALEVLFIVRNGVIELDGINSASI